MSGQMCKAIPRELSRVLYRSFLRASRNGSYPEVFGRYGAIAYNAQCRANDDHVSLALPDSASQVRKRLKSWFQNPIASDNNDIEPLEALPVVHEQEGILPLPIATKKGKDVTASASPPTLPIFDGDEVAVLPGEKTQLLFLEPRYQYMASIVLSTPAKQFLLRTRKAEGGDKCGSASLVKILSHLELDNGAIVVTCLGGRRLSILEEESKSIEGEYLEDETGSSLVLDSATNYCWLNDEDLPVPVTMDESNPTHPPEWMENRQYILDLLNCVLPNQDRSLPETLDHFGLPPLDPEAFSFWALRLVLPVDDTSSRLKWSFECRSVSDRMEYIVNEVESILDAQEDDAASFASSTG